MVVEVVERRWLPGLLTLVAANIVPLVGVVGFGWDLGVLLLLYWTESAVILVFSLVKVAMVSGRAALGLVPFFLVHAGIFMVVHLVFLVALFVDPSWAMLRDVLVGTATLAASHLVSFIVNTVRGGERPKSAQTVMTGFYARIVVMQLTIIFGAMLMTVLGSPVWALVLLIVGKTVVDAGAHVRERIKHALTGQPDIVTPDGSPDAQP